MCPRLSNTTAYQASRHFRYLCGLNEAGLAHRLGFLRVLIGFFLVTHRSQAAVEVTG